MSGNRGNGPLQSVLVAQGMLPTGGAASALPVLTSGECGAWGQPLASWGHDQRDGKTVL